MINEKQTPSVLTHLSLCSGYDGIGVALDRIFPGIRTIAHVEIEAYCCAVLVKAMEAGEMAPSPVFTDLKKFPFHEVAGKVSILSAGFPCQPFSVVGLHQGISDPRHLWPYIADGISLCRPECVFLENVEGIISSKTATGESVLLHVLRDLESRGYRATFGIFSASEVGASHQRRRVFILGLADPGDEGSQGSRRTPELPISEGWVREKRLTGTGGGQFPARPGDDQHSWEESRVIEPRLGRATDGSSRELDPTTNRVDRLRLLGNGVVPDTAEQAFRILADELRKMI